MRRAVVDTNVWVSALLSPNGPPARVLSALEERSFVLITSEWMLEEIVMVLTRPRIIQKYGIGRSEGLALADRLRRRASLVYPRGIIKPCRDPNDDKVIETAVLGRADTLVTRDDDLKGDATLISILEAGGSRS